MREIIRAAFQTGGAAIISMILGVITTKIMAVVLGPDGAGLYGVLLQLQLTAIAFASFGGGTALIQGIASRSGHARDEYLATTSGIFGLAIVMVSVILLLAAPWLSAVVGSGPQALNIELIHWLAVPVALGVGYSYLAGVINGFRAIGRLASVKVVSAAATVLAAYPAFRLAEEGYLGALIGLMAFGAGVPMVYGAIIVWRAGWLQTALGHFRYLLRREAACHFFKIAGSMLVVSQIGNIAFLGVLAQIGQAGGLAAVGVFNSAWNLSMTYVMLVLTSFSTYYLPTLSHAHETAVRDALMRNVFRLSVFVMIPLITTIVVFKPLVIITLYSAEFEPALAIIRWMLIGDYLKVTSWIMGMPALAYADMRTYLLTDAAWYAGFFGLSLISLNVFHSVEGVGLVFGLLYAAYLLFYLFYVGRKFNFHLPPASVRLWWGGFLIILGASLTTWNVISVDWGQSIFWVGIAFAFLLLTLTANERHRIVSIIRLRLIEVRQ